MKKINLGSKLPYKEIVIKGCKNYFKNEAFRDKSQRWVIYK